MGNDSLRGKKIAIVVGGGPAPGINSVISSVTIEALNNGCEVVGVYEGFQHLSKGVAKIVNLTIDYVTRIHLIGGSILKTSRFNPTKDPDHLRNVIKTLIDLDVSYLVTIGGDDTAYSSFMVAEFAEKEFGINIGVVHVPKTIDNDLPLPEGIPTFGFETARELGAGLVSNIMEDARTANRWFIIVAMGRNAGHLALGIGKSAGATLTIIPEEFKEEKIDLQHVVDIICSAIIKRLTAKKNFGVVVAAEGIIEILKEESTKNIENLEYDPHGHIRLREINFSDILKDAVKKELKKLDIDMTIVDKEIGYEVRCAAPNAFDIEYTRNLGFGAVEFLRNGGTKALISIQNNMIVPMYFDDIIDKKTKKIGNRNVNVDSIQYSIARKYMIRLEKDDFESEQKLKKMAIAANLKLDEFIKKYKYLVEESHAPQSPVSNGSDEEKPSKSGQKKKTKAVENKEKGNKN